MLANLGKPEQLDVSENVEQTRTTRKRTTQKGNVGNIEDATQLQQSKNTYKTKKLYNSKDNVATRCGA